MAPGGVAALGASQSSGTPRSAPRRTRQACNPRLSGRTWTKPLQSARCAADEAGAPRPARPVWAGTPADLFGRLPLLLSGSRYVVAPSDYMQSAVVLRTSDATVVRRVPIDGLADLAPRVQNAERLIEMERTEAYDAEGGWRARSPTGIRVAATSG